MKMKFLVAVMIMCLIFGMCGCKVGDQVSSFFKNNVSEEDMVKVFSKGEDLHAKVKLSLTTYFIEHPEKISVEQLAKLKAANDANDAFEVAYKTTKKAIVDIKYAKAGNKITLNDISSELIIFWGKYEEFKKVIQPLLGDRIEYPDETIKTNPSAIPPITIEEIAKE